MNTDDPKFTAYALDELDEVERAEIEQMLRDDPAAAAEMQATRAFADQVRERLRAEHAEGLLPDQRAELLALAKQPNQRKVVPFSGKAAAWTALAASVLVGVGWALIFPTLHSMNPQREKRVAAVPRLAAPQSASDVQVKFGDELAENTTLSRGDNLTIQQPGDQPAPEPLDLYNFGTSYSRGAVKTEPSQLALADVKLPAARAFGEQRLSEELTRERQKAVSTGRNTTEAALGLAYQPNSGTPALEKTTPPASMRNRVAGAQSRGFQVLDRLAAKPETLGRNLWVFSKAPTEHFFAESEVALSSVSDMEGISPESSGTESYDNATDNAFLKVTDAPLSTFSVDVDTASYANVRRYLNANSLPPKAAVRIEEMINYFHYDYPQPDGDMPFSTAMEASTCPWAPEHRLLRVALHGREVRRNARPASNLVFLIDVSGSMQPENKLPLLKRSLQLMVDQLSERDEVGIVVYAGAAGCGLEPTRSKDKIRAALGRLESGGSTHGSAGIQLAYEIAEKHFIKGGTNRVILATDGDWNVGVTDKNELTGLIEKKAKSGVFLTVLGFGMDNLKDDMLEKLADKGNGNYAYIDTLNEGKKVLVDELGATLITIAKDVKIQIEFNPLKVAGYRLIGYENRVMAAKDFADDTKDAGEIGAGHSVTALYELIPAGTELPTLTQTATLKYQRAPQSAPAHELGLLTATDPASKELLTLKLRYKAPDGDKSTEREFPFVDACARLEGSSRDFRFAAAVAGYGMLLRDSPHKGGANWGLVHELAVEGKGEDRDGYRAEFVGLVEKARTLAH